MNGTHMAMALLLVCSLLMPAVSAHAGEHQDDANETNEDTHETTATGNLTGATSAVLGAAGIGAALGLGVVYILRRRE